VLVAMVRRVAAVAVAVAQELLGLLQPV